MGGVSAKTPVVPSQCVHTLCPMLIHPGLYCLEDIVETAWLDYVMPSKVSCVASSAKYISDLLLLMPVGTCFHGLESFGGNRKQLTSMLDHKTSPWTRPTYNTPDSSVVLLFSTALFPSDLSS